MVDPIKNDLGISDVQFGMLVGIACPLAAILLWWGRTAMTEAVSQAEAWSNVHT